MRKKEKQRVLVPIDEFGLAEKRWIQDQLDNNTGCVDFRKWLNQPTIIYGEGYSYWVTPAAAHIVNLLTSPHWKTILKIWKAQRNE